MNKYFELRENNQVLFGVVENIPEKVTLDEIKSRIETSDKSIEIIDGEPSSVDIVMDWLSIDYEYGIETEVVFGALKYMKNNPNASITESIDHAMKFKM